MSIDRITIVGASLAGLSAAEALREQGYDGAITVIDAATALPPDRPPLSKAVLIGTMEPADARQPMASRLNELDLTMVLGQQVTSLDPGTRGVGLADGSSVDGDAVVIATGSSPRHLPLELSGGKILAGVHVLRTAEDAQALRDDLDRSPSRVVVIGAGFIGAEVAASCRSRGLSVTMIETQPLPLQRVLPGPIGEFVADLHREQGVDVRLGVGVSELRGVDRVEQVVLADGAIIEASVVVVGIGVVPGTGWLADTGFEIINGVRSDATCQVAPGIMAAGDVCEWPNDLFGELMRVEQWENAIEQGAHVGRRLLAGAAGAHMAYRPVPWFWSDQYDRKIQLAGRVAPTDEVVVVDGSIEERRFVALFRRDDRCVAVLGVNRPRHVVQLRMKMSERLPWADALAHFA